MRLHCPDAAAQATRAVTFAELVFGYITATLASFFVGPRTGGDRSSETGVEAELARLRRELHTVTVKLERG